MDVEPPENHKKGFAAPPLFHHTITGPLDSEKALQGQTVLQMT